MIFSVSIDGNKINKMSDEDLKKKKFCLRKLSDKMVLESNVQSHHIKFI